MVTSLQASTSLTHTKSQQSNRKTPSLIIVSTNAASSVSYRLTVAVADNHVGRMIDVVFSGHSRLKTCRPRPWSAVAP